MGHCPLAFPPLLNSICHHFLLYINCDPEQQFSPCLAYEILSDDYIIHGSQRAGGMHNTGDHIIHGAPARPGHSLTLAAGKPRLNFTAQKINKRKQKLDPTARRGDQKQHENRSWIHSNSSIPSKAVANQAKTKHSIKVDSTIPKTTIRTPQNTSSRQLVLLHFESPRNAPIT